MNTMMSKMLNAEKRHNIIKNSGIDPKIAGLYPIYFSREEKIRINEEIQILSWCSSVIWGYLSYTGLMVPWHEEEDKERIANFQKKILIDLLKKLEKIDIDLRSYGILVSAISDYRNFERPALLFKQNHMIHWIKDFREYAKSKEMVKRTSEFILEFLQMQVEFSGSALISQKDIVLQKQGSSSKHFLGYKCIADRISYYDSIGVDYREWMREKFKNFKEWKPNERLSFNALINRNSLDPTDNELIKVATDPWMPIRRKIGLNDECQFPDGFFPKGWQPAIDDFDDIKKIAIIKGDGFYYYTDGTQRRGKRHYAKNKYLIIKTNPDNFCEFVESWDNDKLIMSNPTWEEYKEYGMFPDMWNSSGESLHSAVRPLRWRKS